MKETFTLYEAPRLVVQDHPDFLGANSVTTDGDNTAIFCSPRKRIAKDTLMHRSVGKLYCTGRFQLDPLVKMGSHGKKNSGVDELARPESWEYMRLGHSCFEWRGCNIDLIASNASAQETPSLEEEITRSSRSVPGTRRGILLEFMSGVRIQ